MAKNYGKKASENDLNELHRLITQTYISKLEAGEMTPQDMSNAIKFLRDNSIEAIIETDNDMDKLSGKIFRTEFDE